jgi:hypothetical protein
LRCDVGILSVVDAALRHLPKMGWRYGVKRSFISTAANKDETCGIYKRYANTGTIFRVCVNHKSNHIVFWITCIFNYFMRF